MAEHPPATPHGPLVELGDDVWCVRGSFDIGPGLRIGRTMTIVRSGDELTLINALRLADDAPLDRLGRVRHVIKLADGHGHDDPFYVARTQASYWALEGAAHAHLPRDRTLGPECPIPDATVVPVVGTARPEAALHLSRGAGLLIACDALQNHVDTEGASWLARWVTPWMGFKGGVIIAPMWRRNHSLRGPALVTALAGYTARPFEALITAHGPPVRGGAHAAVTATIALAARA